MLKSTNQYLHNMLGENVIQEIMEDSGNTYIGTAPQGSAVNEPKWKIKKIDSNGNLRWSENDQIFLNATSLNYT